MRAGSFMADMKRCRNPWDSVQPIHVELFKCSESMTPGVGAARPTPHLQKEIHVNTCRWYRLRAATSPRTGKHLGIPEHLVLVRRARPVRWSCRTGVCQNWAESGLVSGGGALRNQPLEKPADGNLLICCSQPVRDVVIDL